MTKKTIQPSFEAQAILRTLGQQIRQARLRRNLTQAELAKRAMIASLSLGRLEAGEASVSLAIVTSVLTALNLEESLLLVAAPAQDSVGLALEAISTRKRASKRGDDELDTDF